MKWTVTFTEPSGKLWRVTVEAEDRATAEAITAQTYPWAEHIAATANR